MPGDFLFPIAFQTRLKRESRPVGSGVVSETSLTGYTDQSQALVCQKLRIPCQDTDLVDFMQVIR